VASSQSDNRLCRSLIDWNLHFGFPTYSVYLAECCMSGKPSWAQPAHVCLRPFPMAQTRIDVPRGGPAEFSPRPFRSGPSPFQIVSVGQLVPVKGQHSSVRTSSASPKCPAVAWDRLSRPERLTTKEGNLYRRATECVDSTAQGSIPGWGPTSSTESGIVFAKRYTHTSGLEPAGSSHAGAWPAASAARNGDC
jgi:hypothetical protein